MGRRSIDPPVGRAALARVVAARAAGADPDREDLRPAVRWLLEELADKAPGRSMEVRIPPYAAVQCIPGPRHTRGTPGNVVETDPATWIDLAAGLISWSDARATGRVRASGERSDLSRYLPVVQLSPP